jgi:DNA-binding GntR family transcriptional regulator
MDSLYADLASVARRHQRLLHALVGGSMDEAARAIEDHIRSAAARVVPSLPEGSDA